MHLRLTQFLSLIKISILLSTSMTFTTLAMTGDTSRESNQNTKEDLSQQSNDKNNDSKELPEDDTSSGRVSEKQPYNRFIPTEDIEAANAVPFPVDI